MPIGKGAEHHRKLTYDDDTDRCLNPHLAVLAATIVLCSRADGQVNDEPKEQQMVKILRKELNVALWMFV
jgi:tellurite resistance protein